MSFLSQLQYFLSRLENLEERESFTDRITSIKDQIENLKLELKFLITFFKFIARDENFEDSLGTSKTDILVGLRLVSLSVRLSDDASWADMKKEVCHMVEKIKQSWPIVANYCRFVCVSSPSYILLSYDLVVAFINDLVENFTEVLMSKAYSHLLDTVKGQVEALKGNLKFLTNFLDYAMKGEIDREEMKELLSHSEAVAVEATSLFYSCLVDKLLPQTAVGMNVEFSKLLRKIKPIKSKVRQIYIQVLKRLSSSGSSVLSPLVHEHAIGAFTGSLLDFLLEFLNEKASDMASLSDHMTTLQVELIFLVSLLMDFSQQGINPAANKNDLLRSIEAVTSESGCIIFSLFVNEMKEDISRQMILLLFDLLEKIKLIKGEIKKSYVELSKKYRNKFPRTGGLDFIEFLLGNLKELLACWPDSITMLKQEIKTIVKELESLVPDMAKQCNQEHKEMSNLWTLIVDVAYQAEYVIHSFVIKASPGWHCILWLSDITEEIKLIKANFIAIKEKKADCTSVLNVGQPINSALPSQTNVASDAELMVGFVPKIKKLIERLTRGARQKDTISIVGMSGLGKTTLARKLYNLVTSEFHVCIWCYVSPVYVKRKLLLTILNFLVDPKGIDQNNDDYDLAEMVYKNLKKKKYLIVLDDIWNIEAWDVLTMSFPEDYNGSRVMFTTQLHDVAAADRNPHTLRTFDDNESWDLLREIVFKKESCPPELVEIGKQIAASCRGVPLAVSLIAGVLSKIEKKEDCWERVAKNLTSQTFDDKQTICTKIVGLGYAHLPNHLKSCFLYFGAFMEDPEVSAQNLIWLWIAEGFVRKSEKKSLEEAAEGYLDDLISRSLVKITKLKSRGGVKACQVHDLVCYFCFEKAQEENVLHSIKLHSSDKLPDYYGIGANDAYSSIPTTFEHHRICIYSGRRQFILSRPSGPRARSLLFFAAGHSARGNTYYASFILNSFKLLRVLDLRSLNVGDFPTGLELLVHLRYLAMTVNAYIIPPCLANLWNIETIIIRGSRGEIELPDAIWKMAKLRHLHINNRAKFCSKDQGESFVEKSYQLDNLETVSTPCLVNWQYTEKILRKFPNVRKMRCILLDSLLSIGMLEILSQLESLKVFYHGKFRQLPCEFNLPSNLKSLTLSRFWLPWKEISTIGKLPNLEVLKLLFKAFEGPKWDMIDGEFANLKYLKLDSLDISKWNACNDLFPSLQRLILQSCKQLQEVPSSFGDIPMIERIEVHWCSRSAADSALRIRKDQLELGNEELNVYIHPKPTSEEMDN